MSVCGASIRAKKVCVAWSFVSFVLFLTAQLEKQFAEAARALAEAARVSADALTIGAQPVFAAGCAHGMISAYLFSLLLQSIVAKQWFHAFHILGFFCVVIRAVEVVFLGPRAVEYGV